MLTLATSILIADSIAMALGDYLSSKSDVKYLFEVEL
jgi:hypothetical protein